MQMFNIFEIAMGAFFGVLSKEFIDLIVLYIKKNFNKNS